MGGFIGAGISQAIRYGIARGLFSNESGLGSAPIVAAAAQTRNPVRQALVSSTGTFWDTVVVCAMTGLVVVNSGEWKNGLSGAALTHRAFEGHPLHRRDRPHRRPPDLRFFDRSRLVVLRRAGRGVPPRFPRHQAVPGPLGHRGDGGLRAAAGLGVDVLRHREWPDGGAEPHRTPRSVRSRGEGDAGVPLVRQSRQGGLLRFFGQMF